MNKKICLNMIVKNESAVIQRCLESIKHLIDYWVIVDTGSTDGTQEKILSYMEDIPGELHERPWKDFASNRNQVLELSRGKGDYLLFIDADEKWSFDPDFVFPQLEKDSYLISVLEPSGVSYHREALQRSALGFGLGLSMRRS